MRKKSSLLLALLAVLALASCSNDMFVGETPPISEEPQEVMFPISFGSASKGTTRTDHVGADAANLLNKKFIVAGFKGTSSPATTEVYDDFIVNWKENTAGTTESNLADWEYVGITAEAPSSIAGKKQAIKYWDYTYSQYDFIAYSTGDRTPVTGKTYAQLSAGEVNVTAIDGANAKTAAYTLTGKADDLQNCYIADMVTAYKDGSDPNHKYQDVVQLVFRSLASKVRVALYETIPGYSVKNVKFYTDATTTIATGASSTSATLFATGSSDDNKFYTGGDCTVSFPTIGSSNYGNSDYNKAHIKFSGTSGETKANFGTINYTGAEEHEKTGTKFLGRTSSGASYAGTSPYYKVVMPNENGTVLELRIDYTLEAIDGTGEEINVYGATAFVPAIFAAWKSNYAYTYIFKISDNTNGWTSKVVDSGGNPVDPSGLYPITFDAVVIDSQDYTQSTITTVATPSITTYQKGHNVNYNEYDAGDIYVQVMDNSVTPAVLKKDLNTNGITYLMSRAATEAEVMDALNIQAAGSTADVVKGRNGLDLTKFTQTLPTKIPGEDGNDITVNPNTAAKFTATGNKYYAYVYKVSDNTDTYIRSYVELTAEPSDWADGVYFTDEACTSAAPTMFVAGSYYRQYTNLNTVYAVKVIKIK